MRRKIWIGMALGLAAWALAAEAAEARGKPAKVMEWTVDGVKREALVSLPARPSEGRAPILLVFHGHGGSMQNMARKGFEEHWPEAIVVYPQGLPTATGRDPEGEKPGWQQVLGSSQDRDLKLVDAILKTLIDEHKGDETRVYATGHSNGGGFTYLLWEARGDRLAAIAASSAGGRALLEAKQLRAIPVLQLAGEKDPIVPFELQERILKAIRRHNGCDPEPMPWARAGALAGTVYPSKGGTPVVSLRHPGGHQYPDEAPGLIVKFFKEH